jgi:hypothetical protein
MSNRVEAKKDENAGAGLREWATSSSEQSGFGAVARHSHVGCAARHQDAGTAGRRARGRTGRPVCARRLDLVTEQWAAVLRLVKLEPLNEP